MSSRGDRRRQAGILAELHAAPRLLVLPNVWNPLGARILAAQGYPAVATASAAISASLGYADGERLRRGTMLEVVRRIVDAVDLPVTADLESGYGDTPRELEDSIRALLEAGAVGVNLEDAIVEGGPLRDLSTQCERIARARRVAGAADVPLVINARTDAFLSSAFPSPEEALEEAVRRAAAYAEAGADCVYPIGPGDAATVRTLRRRIHSPINVLAGPGAAPLPELESLGVNRVSFGPYVFRTLLRHHVEITADLARGAGYGSIEGRLSRDEAAVYLRDEPEREPRGEGAR